MNLPSANAATFESFKYSSKENESLDLQDLKLQEPGKFHLSLLIISKSHIKLYHGLGFCFVVCGDRDGSRKRAGMTKHRVYSFLDYFL